MVLREQLINKWKTSNRKNEEEQDGSFYFYELESALKFCKV